MSWIKEANKIGRYVTTHHGFRIYCTQEPSTVEKLLKRTNGVYLDSEHVNGKYVAVDKSGERIEGEKWFVVGKIDILNIQRRFF